MMNPQKTKSPPHKYTYNEIEIKLQHKMPMRESSFHLIPLYSGKWKFNDSTALHFSPLKKPYENCRDIRKTYLENQLGLEKDVQESQPKQGWKAAQQSSTQIEVATIRSKEGSTGETGKNDSRHEKSIGNQTGIDPDSHVQKGSSAEAREKGKAQKQGQTSGSIFAIVRGRVEAESQAHA